jgi:hypothetical protein
MLEELGRAVGLMLVFEGYYTVLVAQSMARYGRKSGRSGQQVHAFYRFV